MGIRAVYICMCISDQSNCFIIDNYILRLHVLSLMLLVVLIMDVADTVLCCFCYCLLL